MDERRAGAWSAPSMTQMNFWYTLIFYGFSAVLGSVTSFFLSAAFVWALVRLAQKRFALIADRRILVLSVVFAAYPLSELWSVIVNERGLNGLASILGQLVFLAVLPVSSRLVLSTPDDILTSAGRGAATGGILAFAYSVFEVTILGLWRSEAGYGNPAVLGVMSLVLASICVVAAQIAQGRERTFLFLGAFAAIGATLLSGTRAAWLTAPVALAAAAMPFWRTGNLRFGKLNLAFAFSSALLIAAISMPVAINRFNDAVNSLEKVENGTPDISFGPRLAMWKAGLEQASEHPWTGYGPDMARKKIASIKALGQMEFSHYHNFAVTALIRGGVFELLAILAIPAGLIWLALKRSENDFQLAGKALLLSTVTTFYLTGTVGILFTHDIINATFVYTAIIGICLATSRYPGPETGHGGRASPLE